MTALDVSRIEAAVLGLDRWFDAMRVDWPTPGYGGPVVHWWNHSLAYSGAGLDWRYEGIVAGYLTLWRQEGERAWLDKAIRAGSDLLEGQLPNGHFRNSEFERNPGEGGTPHEAAADVALLLLARELAVTDAALSRRFLAAAARNLDAYWFGRLWHEPTATLWDSPSEPSFVPNKAATFLEAVLLLAEATGDRGLIEDYALPTGDNILAMQVGDGEALMAGAIAQNRFGDHVVQSYFPLYIARCVPPLLGLADATGETRFRQAALAAVRFLQRVQERDGDFPQVLYGDGHRKNRNPRWIAATGDVLRAFYSANHWGALVDLAPTVSWILRGVRRDGHIATAEGFGRIVPLLSRIDRASDEIGVVGWCDKPFRALALLTTSGKDEISDSAAVAMATR